MIRRLIIAAALVAAVVAVVLIVSSASSPGGYRVRAIFDNGGFMVTGEQVRIAGATVGEVEEEGVTMPEEVVGYSHGRPVHKPGKAWIVFDITAPGFQDFRQDAGCMIRPQSLIGEKYIDCRPTLPRAPGSQPPPPLKTIPSGQPGAGEHLLPLGSNGTSVDPDLINNIQSLPYAQRFRLIFNELGAGLAGRGEDLEVLVKRANPALREVDRLFAILTAQRNELAQLASNSEEILGPLSRERAQVAGFLANAGAAGQASSERGPQLEEALQKFPRFLTEFRKTMRSLGGFSTAATPVFQELGRAAPSLTDATRTLTPFSQALTVSLKSFGKAGAASGPLFAKSVPVVRKAGTLARSGVKSTHELAALFTSLKQTGGWDGLVELIYNGAGTVNGFDNYGHFGRTLVTLTNCVEYEANSVGSSGCSPRFNGENAREGASASALYRLLMEYQREEGTEPTGRRSNSEGLGQGHAAEGPKAATAAGKGSKSEGGSKPGVAESSKAEGPAGTEPLLNYLLGP